MSAPTPDGPAGDLTLAKLHRRARARLEAAGLTEATLDARLLTEHFTRTTRKDALIDPDRAIDEAARQRLDEALARRLAGEPVHRIIGMRDFYGLPLSLSTETLEPRPDTEALVDLVLPFVRERAATKAACRILDLGTGTGAIALALLANVPTATAVLTDVSANALVTAQRNAVALGLAARAEFVRSDWFDKISGRFDVIVSNPPYIPSEDIASLQPEVRNFDPTKALDGGKDGLDAYRAIANGAGERLRDDGIVAVEIGSDQRDDVASLFKQAGFGLSASRRDLGGHERALLFAAKGATQKTLGITEECG